MSTLLKRLVDAEPTCRGLLLLTLIYLVPAYQAMLPVEDPDLWWHLRTGQWILDHGWVPFQDSFSAYGSGKPWVAYSWLYELLALGVFKAFGLVGVVWTAVIISVLIALGLHVLVRMAGVPLVAEVALLAFALGAMKPVMYFRSWLFSILFFVIELVILFRVRRNGNTKLLFFLPPIFILWTNLHIQFVYGLAVLGIFTADVLFRRLVSTDPQRQNVPALPLNTVVGAAVLSLLAILVTPYHYRVVLTVFGYMTETGVFLNVQELHPMLFLSPSEWLALALAVSAAFALWRRRSPGFFRLLLFILAVAISVRLKRDAWVVVSVSLFVIGECYYKMMPGKFFQLTPRRITLVIVFIVTALMPMSRYRGISESQLSAALEKQFPVKAVRFVKERRYTGPVYNHFDWGGFLIWALPSLPVSMDGRTNVHGDERIARSLATWSGTAGWDLDPELANARLVIADHRRPLTSLLRKDSRFKVVYEDHTAVVFVASSMPGKVQ